MRKLKITVALLLAVVSAVFIATRYINNHSGKNGPPILKCDTDTVTVSVSDGDDVLLRGVSAYDNQDGDLTSGIVIGGISKLISDNTAKITYMVFDSDNNMARMTRLVKYTDYKTIDPNSIGELCNAIKNNPDEELSSYSISPIYDSVKNIEMKSAHTASRRRTVE